MLRHANAVMESIFFLTLSEQKIHGNEAFVHLQRRQQGKIFQD